MSKFSWEKNEPVFNPLDYKGSITKALSFYAAIDNDLKKSWTIAHWKAEERDVGGIEKLPDWAFAQLGVLVRLLNKGVDLSADHRSYINRKYEECMVTVLLHGQVKPKPPSGILRAPVDKTKTIACDIGSDIDAEIDNITTTGKRHVNIKSLFVGHNVTEAAGEVISSRYDHQLVEFQKALETPSEEFEHLPKKTIKLLVDCLTDVMTACKKSVTVRKPRKKKAVDPDKVVAKVKYLDRYDPLGMVSENPTRMVGSNEIWLFNVKLRKLFRYIPNKGELLSIKGTSIINFDDKLSSAKTIRKVDVFFSPLNDFSAKSLNREFDLIQGVSAKAPGRISDDMIIFKIF